MAPYNLFISHSWAYGDAYEKLISFLDDKPYFRAPLRIGELPEDIV